MNASDIPTAHKSPLAMARCLVTYIDDPRRVRREILANYNSAPSLGEIMGLRRRFLEPEPAAEPCRSNDAYYPMDAAKSLTATNAAFVARIMAERRRPTLRVRAA